MATKKSTRSVIVRRAAPEPFDLFMYKGHMYVADSFSAIVKKTKEKKLS